VRGWGDGSARPDLGDLSLFLATCRGAPSWRLYLRGLVLGRLARPSAKRSPCRGVFPWPPAPGRGPPHRPAESGFRRPGMVSRCRHCGKPRKLGGLERCAFAPNIRRSFGISGASASLVGPAWLEGTQVAIVRRFIGERSLQGAVEIRSGHGFRSGPPCRLASAASSISRARRVGAAMMSGWQSGAMRRGLKQPESCRT